METLAVRGYVEVLRNLTKIFRMRAALIRQWLRDPPSVFVGIDAPDFNLGLEARLKAEGIKTVQYVSPQIWAWRPERVAKVKRAASLVLTVFPFETPLLEKEQVRAKYVGHPLAETLPLAPDRRAARERLDIPQSARVIALLPGGRRSVVRNMAPLYIKTARLVAQRLPGVTFAAPFVSEETREQFSRAIKAHGGENLRCSLFVGRTHDVMAASDAVLVTAGTASLEAALAKRPMVITYRLSRLSHWTLKRKITGRYVGLPNILAGREVVPELIQENATPQKLADALLAALAQDTQELTRIFTEMHHSLRSPHSAADAVLELVDG